MTKTLRTTCPYCGVGCGVLAQIDAAGAVTIKGDPEHPANYGRLCSKGAALAETLDEQDRLLHPEINGERCNWDAALQYVAEGFKRIVEQHGPDAVAFYVSGQLLTEDYYVANKLMKGFIGSANIDTNSRLCMSSAVAGHKRAFGSDTVPGCYEDLERAKLIVLVGSNTAWCHPVLFQRIKKSKQDNPDLMVVVIDPRRTASCDLADMHLAIKPGMDQLLFNGLMVYLYEQGEMDEAYVSRYTEGLDAALATAREATSDLAALAAACGLGADELEAFYRLFARTQRVVSAYSQGINQWDNGTDRVNAIINCHLLSGRIGRPGMGPLSLTGQPNAMGGREVGGLANQLAAHRDIANPEHRQQVQTFWQSPLIAEHEGLKAVEMFQAIETGKIKAVWIMATNPAVSLPDSHQVRRALANCDLVVVSDCVSQNDTLAYANVKLPAKTWGEREGTVTNSERCISRQRAFLDAAGEARSDWQIIAGVAKHMGFDEAFAYSSAAEIFKEHALLSAHANEGRYDFDLSALTSLSSEEYEQLSPCQWPINQQYPQGRARLFAEGGFYHPGSRARFIPIAAHPRSDASPSFILNTGRIRDQWHTMTRSAKSARLSAHIYEPFCQIHPDDGQALGIHDQGLVEVSNEQGRVVVRAQLDDSVRKGETFVPIHWSDQFASEAVVTRLIPAKVDPVSGQPAFKGASVALKPYQAKWYGFLLSRRRLNLSHADYWSCSRWKGLWRYELAGDKSIDDWSVAARQLLCHDDEDIAWIEYHDRAQSRYRAARLTDKRLESCLFISPEPQLPARDWLMALFSKTQLDDSESRALLTARADSGEEPGKTVCACFGVSDKRIRQAIEQEGLESVEEISARLKAGSNCGSCLPEIHLLLQKERSQI